MKPRKGSHSVFSVMIWQVCRKLECELIEFSGESDHVHILLDFHPQNSISAVAGCLKSSTARTMKKDFPDQVNKFYKSEVSFWSNSYYVASSGGAPIEKLKEYIKNQDTPKS